MKMNFFQGKKSKSARCNLTLMLRAFFTTVCTIKILVPGELSIDNDFHLYYWVMNLMAMYRKMSFLIEKAREDLEAENCALGYRKGHST